VEYFLNFFRYRVINIDNFQFSLINFRAIGKNCFIRSYILTTVLI